MILSTECGISEGGRGREGRWEAINRRPCVHRCMARGRRQWGVRTWGARRQAEEVDGEKEDIWNTFNNKEFKNK